MPKAIAVVGGKHSGKTTVIVHLIAELKHRGYLVGTIKEMVRIPTLDTPETETDRYTRAGAEIVVAVPRQETVVFIKKRLNLHEILPYCKGLDYVVLEGFETEKALPKIVAAKTIEVNKPLHYGRFHFYQHSYDDQNHQYTVLSVASDSGLYCVYAGFLLLCLGTFWKLWFGRLRN